MKTIDKALSLLDYFSSEAKEWRLSDLARAAGMDKVTAMRCLNSMAAKGFVEQHPETKKYRLGTAFLHFARIRESSFPVAAVLQPILEKLCEETGETTHACLFSGLAMTTIAIAEPNRSTRVYVDPAQPLPVHAAASGIAYLSQKPEEFQRSTLERAGMTRMTERTPGDLEDFLSRVRTAGERGFAIADRTHEDDVTGIAAPILGWQGDVMGTLAAACVSSRLNAQEIARISKAVISAAGEASRCMGAATL
ncbi:MAG: IclR family transcriptional regulator [Rhodobacteraceae bacterium]|nr:IclR family transcriptional regulator [Paracoccaceae bacterium]